MAPSVTGEKGTAEEPKEPAAAKRMITPTSSEGQEFRVTEAEARLSSHLAGMIGNGDNVVALRNVPARALDTMTKYCNKHAAAANPSPSASAGSSSFNASSDVDQELDEWDRELVRALDTVTTKYRNRHAAAANPSPSAAAGRSSFNAAPCAGQELDEWDRELVRGLNDVDALYDLLIAANFLRLDGLVDTVCEKVADIIDRCETPKQIRETFRVPDDLTAEEKEAISMEYSWAFGADDI